MAFPCDQFLQTFSFLTVNEESGNEVYTSKYIV